MLNYTIGHAKERYQTKVGRVAVASIAAIPIGIAIELGLEVSTSLDCYNATLSQAIDAARHSIVMPHGIRDCLIWTGLTAIVLVFNELRRVKARPLRPAIER